MSTWQIVLAVVCVLFLLLCINGLLVEYSCKEGKEIPYVGFVPQDVLDRWQEEQNAARK